MTPFELIEGDGPVILGLPHCGTWLPDEALARLNARGRELADTDWHIHRLYDGLLPGVTSVRATFHRYLIDANRAPSDDSLYPGQNTTGLCPLTDFDGNDIYLPGSAPDADETARRRSAFHAPYHAALAAQMRRVRDRHGVAILYDCHSIRSRIPFLFAGVLPDFNIGTNNGTTCAPEIAAAAGAVTSAAVGYSTITNGRFRGGWTTRHYGQPAQGFHAIQMELAQSTYLCAEAAPWTYDDARADRLRSHLSEILHKLADLAPKLRGTP